MSKHIKNENYINIQGWMINELHLKGNQLLVYAIIYGFSQDNESMYIGTQSYLAEWISSSKETVRKVLNELVEKELLIKLCEYKNNIKFVYYKANSKYFGGYPKNLGGVPNNFKEGIQENWGNNNKYNNKDDIVEAAADKKKDNPPRDLDKLTKSELETLKQLIIDNSDTKNISYRDIQKIFNLVDTITYDTPSEINKLLKRRNGRTGISMKPQERCEHLGDEIF